MDDWYNATYAEDDVGFIKIDMPKSVTPSPPETTLLSFPKAKDRSHSARREQQWQAYQGELEPQGVRGQHAKVVPSSNQSNNSDFVPVRSFAGDQWTGSHQRKQQRKPYSQQRKQQQQQQQQQQRKDPYNTSDIFSVDDSSLSTSQWEMHENNTAEIAQQELSLPWEDNQEEDIASFRKSAPVDVDDSSFQDPVANVQGIHAMAMEHVLNGEYDMALSAFSQVLKVYLELYGRAHPLTASAYHNLGTVHSKRAGLLLDNTEYQRRCREQALKCFQAAARSARDAIQLGPNHPNVAVSLVRIGFLLLQSRQYQSAAVTFQEALRIRQQHYGHSHALVANLFNNLGVCHMHLQDFPLGRNFLQQALNIQRQLVAYDENDAAELELADTLCNIGGLCMEWIRQQGPDSRHSLDAESTFLEALEIRRTVLGENHALTNQVRSLYDMVRSIPIPTPIPSILPGSRRRQSLGRVPSPGRESRSPGVSSRTVGSAHSVYATSTPGRPYATGTPSPPQSVQAAQWSSSKSARRTPISLDMPILTDHGSMTATGRYKDKDSINRAGFATSVGKSPSPGTNVTQQDRSVQSGLDSTFSSMDEGNRGATEESCLLTNKFVEDDGRQASTIVSYAQAASAGVSKKSDRSRVLQQAKAVLEANKDFIDSPQELLDNKSTSTGFSFIQPTTNLESAALEDGLAPLGGTWPQVAENRITPEALELPGQHMPTIQKCASNYVKRGRLGEALHLLELILDVQRFKNGPYHEDVGAALHNVGTVQLRLDDHFSAIHTLEEAVRVRKEALGKDHPQVAESLVKVGITLLLMTRYEDSLWSFREALTVRKHALGPLHPSTARIYNNIGCVHVEMNELKEARRAFEAALNIQRNALVQTPESGPIMFGAALTLQNLGYLYRERGMFEKAVAELKQSQGVSYVAYVLCLFQRGAVPKPFHLRSQLYEKVLGNHHPTVMSTLESLAETFWDAEEEALSLKYFNEILERLHDQDEESKFQEATILHKMSKVHLGDRDLESELTKLQIALTVLRMETSMSSEAKLLANKIHADMEMVRQELEKQELKWV